MSSLLESLAQSLGNEGVEKMSQQIGAEPEQTADAMGLVLPALIGALRRNAAQPQGAESILGALKRDHDGGILDRVSDFLGKREHEQPRSGGGILGHIFGNKQQKVEQGVSKASGLDTAAIAGLMKMLAPLVMGALAKQVSSNNIGAEELPGYLEQETQQFEVKEKKFSLLGKFLDQDGDGDFDFQDITKLGVGMLFKRR